MNSRQRTLAVLHRQPVDRTPVDLWLTPEVLGDLMHYTGTNDALEMCQHLGVDKIFWANPPYRQDDERRSAWGVSKRRVQSGLATYYEDGEAPWGNYEDIGELDDYARWPDPARFDYDSAHALAKRANEAGFAVIGPWISFFEIYCQLRGLENAMMDILEEPEFLDSALDRIELIQTEMLKRYLGQLGDSVDLVFISDDIGSQTSQLISLEAFAVHLLPRIRRWCDLIHHHGKKVLFHTDGAARTFFPQLIDAGVDVLNPIQHVCPGMERSGLKRDFGARVIFHGGVENQHVLPHGSPEAVRRETIACLDTLGAGGGYLPCSCHNIQAGTPIENVLALIQTVHDYPPHPVAGIHT